MAAQEACLVLGDVGTRTCAEDGDFLLNFLNVIVAGLEVDLEERAVSLGRVGDDNGDDNGEGAGQLWPTCLTATVSPVAFSMALYTTPKLPPEVARG